MSSILHSVAHGWSTFANNFSSWMTSVGQNIGPLAVAAFVLGAVILVTYAAILIFGQPRSDLEAILEPYKLHQPVAQGGTAESAIVTIPALRRISEWLSNAAEQRGFRRAIETKLVRAGLPIGVGELLLVCLFAMPVLAVFGFAIAGVVGILLGIVLAAMLPFGVLEVRANRRFRQFEAQLPDLLKLLAASLRAGFSLLQALDAVSVQIHEPMGRELRRALAASRVGVPVEDALDGAAERVGSADFGWVVTAVRIQREVGGNLAEILETVAHTMIERGRLRREVRTLTAEGRISAIILGIMPIAIGLFLYLIDRQYISELFTTFPGQIAMVVGAGLELLGVWWLFQTVKVGV